MSDRTPAGAGALAAHWIARTPALDETTSRRPQGDVRVRRDLPRDQELTGHGLSLALNKPRSEGEHNAPADCVSLVEAYRACRDDAA